MTKREDQNAINDLTLGVVRLSRVRVTCPGCHQPVLAVARDGVIRGWCSISRQRVDFQIETQRIENPTAETPVDGVVSGIVSAYLRGVKTVVILEKYGISSGSLYRLLHAANVGLRTGKPNNNRKLNEAPRRLQ